MTFTAFFDINNTLVTIPLGSGYDMSWIEAISTLFGLLCIWYASQEKTINYLFGLLNVSLFAILFYQIQLYGLLLLQVFFFVANVYGWYAWTRPNEQGETLEVRWMSPKKQTVTLVISIVAVALMTLYIDPIFVALTHVSLELLSVFGVVLPAPELEPDSYPFWDAAITILSIVAQILMTRKYVENWILWVVINLLSIGVYTAQGVYALSVEYLILLFIAIHGTREWVATAKQRKTPTGKELHV